MTLIPSLGVRPVASTARRSSISAWWSWPASASAQKTWCEARPPADGSAHMRLIGEPARGGNVREGCVRGKYAMLRLTRPCHSTKGRWRDSKLLVKSPGDAPSMELMLRRPVRQRQARVGSEVGGERIRPISRRRRFRYHVPEQPRRRRPRVDFGKRGNGVRIMDISIRRTVPIRSQRQDEHLGAASTEVIEMRFEGRVKDDVARGNPMPSRVAGLLISAAEDERSEGGCVLMPMKQLARRMRDAAELDKTRRTTFARCT
jgi:hypothetical protein